MNIKTQGFMAGVAVAFLVAGTANTISENIVLGGSFFFAAAMSVITALKSKD